MSKEQAKPKRPSNNPNGRPKGALNKSTRDVREAFGELMKNAVPKMGEWLDRVAEVDPGKALQLTMMAAEYHIPKLARTEHVGEGGGPVEHRVVERRIVRADHSDR